MVRAAASSSHASPVCHRTSACTGPATRPKGGHRPADTFGDARLGGPAEPARGDVDALLEVRAVERVGLVEERQHLEPAVGEQALDRDLRPGDEGLDQQPRPFVLVRRPRPGHDGPHPLDRSRELPGIIGPDHPPARGHRDRLDHAGKRDPGEVEGAAQVDHPELRHPDPGRGEPGPREVLAAREPGRAGRVSGEAEIARHPPGQLHRRVVRGHHRGEPALASGGGPDRFERPIGIAEVDPQASLRSHRVLALGHHEEPRPETGRSAEIRRDPIASRRRDEERRAAGRGQAWAAPHPVQPPLPPVAMNTLLNTKLEPVGRVTKSISTPRR